MPKKVFLVLILLVITNYQLLITNYSVSAYSLSLSNQTTCDLCGWCNKDVNPKPPDWDKCRECLYKPDGTPKEGTHYTVIGCLSTRPGQFIQSLLTIIFGISGGLAFLAVLFGSVTVLTAASDPQQLQKGKDIIISSIVGIFLIVFSVFLLRLVGLDILRIPGFASQ